MKWSYSPREEIVTLMMSNKENGYSSEPVRKMYWFRSFDWREFVCGCGAAFVNIGATYPIYKMIFRQILHGVKIGSAYDQIKHEGFTYLYRGILPPLAQKTISLSIMFGVYNGTRRQLVDYLHMNPYVAKSVAGMVSGSVEATLLPFERVQTLLADSKFHLHFRNTAESFRYVYVNHGFTELYRGVVPVLLRNGPSNVLFFIFREEALNRLPQQESVSTKTAQEFISGALIGATLSMCFYPLNVIKVAMQSNMGHPSESIFAVGHRIYRERGNSIRCFYRGCWFNASRAFLSWGIMNTAYERIKQLIY